ncbi:hypothetical protein CYY_003396 [Polysphondylium violaceum]|uniref:Uncharacterized protein n=1 Tax=Polysphondylium violaceum TaxID=133409 RepID=A0A8J4PYJ8_9MYCE|nr:hypothetical protein CYY_003396 [Polysphondylium violaceum]
MRFMIDSQAHYVLKDQLHRFNSILKNRNDDRHCNNSNDSHNIRGHTYYQDWVDFISAKTIMSQSSFFEYKDISDDLFNDLVHLYVEKKKEVIELLYTSMSMKKLVLFDQYYGGADTFCVMVKGQLTFSKKNKDVFKYLLDNNRLVAKYSNKNNNQIYGRPLFEDKFFFNHKDSFRLIDGWDDKAFLQSLVRSSYKHYNDIYLKLFQWILSLYPPTPKSSANSSSTNGSGRTMQDIIYGENSNISSWPFASRQLMEYAIEQQPSAIAQGRLRNVKGELVDKQALQLYKEFSKKSIQPIASPYTYTDTDTKAQYCPLEEAHLYMMDNQSDDYYTVKYATIESLKNQFARLASDSVHLLARYYIKDSYLMMANFNEHEKFKSNISYLTSIIDSSSPSSSPTGVPYDNVSDFQVLFLLQPNLFASNSLMKFKLLDLWLPRGNLAIIKHVLNNLNAKETQFFISHITDYILNIVWSKTPFLKVVLYLCEVYQQHLDEQILDNLLSSALQLQNHKLLDILLHRTLVRIIKPTSDQHDQQLLNRSIANIHKYASNYLTIDYFYLYPLNDNNSSSSSRSFTCKTYKPKSLSKVYFK